MEEVRISRKCFRCAGMFEFTVSAEGLRRWREDGVLLQDALPEVSVANRELLLSGTCGTCFQEIFPTDGGW